MVINEKIRAVLAQLPVRMTKTKFFDLLRESFTIYRGSSSDGLDSYLDRIKTSATIFSIEDTDDFSLLKSELSKFDDVDYASITEDEFKNLTDHYRVISKYLEVYTNFYSIYQGLVNNIYTCMICQKYNEDNKSDESIELYKNLEVILSHLRECYDSGFTMDIDDEVSAGLICVEGVQEKSHELSMQLESGIIDGLLDKYAEEDVKVKEAIVDLKKCSKLVSNSLFMELEDVKTCEVTSEMIEKITTALETELKELFRSSQKVYTRAVMANVLSELPVFFKDIAEVSEYVTNQFTSCGNESEKMACYAILSDIMEEDY
jgi:hypothetical protein